MLASLLISISSLSFPILTRKVFNDFVPNKNVEMIIIYGAILLGIYVIRMLLKYFVAYYGHVMGVKMQAEMRSDMMEHLEKLPYTYYDNHETGKIMSRMTNDLQNVSELAHHGPENLFICGLTLIASFIYLCTINVQLSLIIFACAPIMATISIIFRKRMRKAFTETRKSIAEINASVETSVTGIRATKAFNNADKELEKFEEKNKQFLQYRSIAYKAMGQFQSSTDFASNLFNVALIVGGGLITIYTDIFSLADYLAFAVSISMFMSPLTQLINFVETYQEGITGFTRFIEIMDEPIEEESPNAIDDIVLKGDITFDHVNFSYRESKEILDDINFEIKCGESVALVGSSGGGKTTICHLIPRFYDVGSGGIYIDGHNIKDLSFRLLRESIGIVQQDVFLFTGTIRDNIMYGRLDASEEEMIDACKKAELYDFVMSLPHGFDTAVGERGIKLSGGQKQRISIARIFLKNPPILILDEATSALDNVTEFSIQESLNELAKGRTNIVVAHRLSTIKNANRILVIDKGRVLEDGSHEELMKNQKEYAELYSLQFKE